MKRETYGDPQVREVLRRAFLPVYVDADARPDLAERFRNYRWPATAFLTPEGDAIHATRGYRSPRGFLELLAWAERIWRRGGPYPGFKDPNAGGGKPAGPANEATLRKLRDRLRAQLDRYWDEKAAGWGTPQKYPVAGPILAAFVRARLEPATPGAKRGVERALRTLDEMRALIDPVDGGMYQYSLEGRWDRWHPEKIAAVNAGALAAYSEALPHVADPSQRARFQEAAKQINRWLFGFLRSEQGVYYASQDADAPGLEGERYYRLPGPERRKYGTPRVDENVYARENGWIVQATLARGRHLDPPQFEIDLARETVNAIVASHRDADGTIRHAAADVGPRRHLSDQVEMGRAFLALHQATGEAAWLEYARRTADVLSKRFAARAGGFFDVTLGGDEVGVFKTRSRSLEPNASAAMFLLDLASVTGEPLFRTAAIRTIIAMSNERRLAGHWRNVGELLIACDLALRPARKIAWHGPMAPGGGPEGVLGSAVRATAWDSPAITWAAKEAPEDGNPFAVVCEADGTCSDRIYDVAALKRALGQTSGSLLGR